VFVSNLRLVNFRSYCDATVSFGAGLNVVVGQNAAGKTNLLEGAWFALRGSSPRTRREEKLVTWGERFTRVELELDGPAAGPQAVEVAYAPGQGKRARWNGVEVASQDELRGRTQVFIFVPESLLLVKGSPARRRAHLDAFAAALDPQYAAASRELQTALRQRNAQLLAVRNGAPASTLDPWDVQFARAAAALGRRRRDLVAELTGRFAAAAGYLAPEGNSFTLQLVSQLAAVGYDEPPCSKSCAPGDRARPGGASPSLAPTATISSSSKSMAARLPRGSRATRRRTPGVPPFRPPSLDPRAAPSSCRAAAATCASSVRRASSAPPCWRCCSRSSSWRRRAPASRAHSSWTT